MGITLWQKETYVQVQASKLLNDKANKSPRVMAAIVWEALEPPDIILRQHSPYMLLSNQVSQFLALQRATGQGQ